MSAHSPAPSINSHSDMPAPAIKDCVPLDSLDARILQYRYASQKILKLVENVKFLVKTCSQEKKIAFTKYIILLNGCIFNVNDNIYRRSEILINGNKFNPAQSIEPSPNIGAVSFDCMDNSTNYDTTKLRLPTVRQSLDTLKLLELLLINTFEIYDHKWKIAMNDRSSQETKKDKPLFTLDDISDVLEFPELQSMQLLIDDEPENTSADAKADVYLRSIDLKSLKVNLANFELAMDAFRDRIDALGRCKVKENLLSSPRYKYILQRSFLLLLHLADFYGVVRKFGKVLYHNNSFYFENYARTSESLRVVMRNFEVYFNQSKKNNLLLAAITKITRNGSLMAVRPDHIVELYKVSDDAHSLLSTMVFVLRRFQAEWQVIIDSNRSNEFDKEQLRRKLKEQTIREQNEQKRLQFDAQLGRNMEALHISPEKFKADMEKQSKFQKELFDDAREARLIREADVRDQEQQKAEEMEQKVGEREKQLREELRSARSSPNSLSRQSSISRSRSSSLQSNKDDGFIRRSKSTSSKRNSLLVTPEIRRMIPEQNETMSDPTGPLIDSQSPNINSTTAGAGASSTPTLRLQTNLSKPQNSPVDHARAAALASKKVTQPPLTAQQRLQQHIIKSSQSGQAIAKRIEPKPRPRSFYAQLNGSPAKALGGSNSGSRSNSLQSDAEFPTSPLNSLKQSNFPDSQAQTNRSRSGSLQGSEHVQSPGNNAAGRASPSNSVSRSRSGSLSQRPVSSIPEGDETAKDPEVDNVAARNSPNKTSENSSIKTRSRASSTRQNGPPQNIGNVLVVPENSSPELDTNGEVIKKVRFTGVPEYSEDEDAPTPQQMQKQMRQKWSSYKPQFRNRTKQLNSQEGLAFRKFQGSMVGGEFEGFSKVNANSIPVEVNGKFSMMSVINSPESPGPSRKLTKLFKRR
ncbi:hypothetical protein KL927_000087 [Ogataea polymorpha]|nr:hypothetical protein KL927_000087 [Ogataea polymorpha]